MPVKTAAQEMATCTTTHYTLEIVARSGVAVEGDLDEEVRALKSPSSNFIWDGASVVGTTTETWSGEEVRDPTCFRTGLVLPPFPLPLGHH